MNRTRFTSALAMAALATILLPSSLRAKITFQRTYGGTGDDYGYSVQQTVDDGYIVMGTSKSFGAGSYDVYLVKTDSLGDTLWTRSYGGAGDDEGRSVQQTTDGGYIIAGYTSSFGAGGYDVYLVKTNTQGDTLWTRTYGGTGDDEGRSVQQTTDGGFIVAGYTNSFGAGSYDVYLIKTNASGDTLWTRTYGGGDYDRGYSVQQTADSGYIVTGLAFSFSGYPSISGVYLIKTNASGDTLWATAYYAGAEYGSSVRQATTGGYITAGYCDPEGGDVCLIWTSDQGNEARIKAYGGYSIDVGYSVAQTADYGYIVAGYTESFGAGGRDVYLIKTNNNRDTMWTRTFGGDSDDVGYSVQQTADDGYIIAGGTKSYGVGSWDVYLIKTDSLGNAAVAEPRTSPTRAPSLSLTCEPNPTSGTTTIRLSPFALRQSPLTLRIYDSQGRLVHSVSGIRASSFPLDLRSMPDGAYFIRCDVAGEHATARVVLQR